MNLNDEEMVSRTDTDAAIGAGGRIATAEQQPRVLEEGGVPFALGRNGSPVSLEAFLLKPIRVGGTFNTSAVPSFVAYVKRFQTPGTLLTAALPQGGTPTVTASLDYHVDAEQPRAGRHAAILSLAHSEEWKAWIGAAGRAVGQQALAEFLEERLTDIRDPEAAAVLEAVKNLDLHKGATYRKAINLDTGQVQFGYVEEVSGQGQFTLPTLLTLGLRPFERSEPYQVLCRLRYRLSDDKLVFTLKLDRPDRIVEGAFADVLKAVSDATGSEVLWGKVG